MMEVTLRQLMERAGKGVFFQDIARVLQKNIGKGGANMVLQGLTVAGGALGSVSPLRSLLAPVLKRAGIQADSALEIAASVASAVGEGLPEGMAEGLDEAEIRKRTEAKFNELTSEGGSLHGKFKKLITTPADEAKATAVFAKKMVIGGATVYEIHDAACPECQPRTQPGKKGPVTKTGDGITRHALGWTMEQGYRPTQRPCCTRAVAKLIKTVKTGGKKMKLGSIIEKLRETDQRERLAKRIYTAAFNSSVYSYDQRKELNRILAADAWEEDNVQLVSGLILDSITQTPTGGRFDPERFLERLRPFAPKEPTTAERVNEIGAELEKARETVEEKLCGYKEEIQKVNARLKKQRRALEARRRT